MLPHFSSLRAKTKREAVQALADCEPASLVAGGTDLVVLARKKRAPLAEVLVAVHRIEEITGVAEAPGGGLRIGAATPHAEIERHPLIAERFTALADGSALVGSPATRHVGTIGGNLANASPANDTGSALLVFDATVELASAGGTRTLPLSAFFAGPGETALAPGELLAAVTIPPPPPGRTGSAYVRLDYRQAMEIAVVGAAAVVRLDDDSASIIEARLALTAVAPTCVEVDGIGESVRARDPNDPAVWDEAARLAAAAARPIDDVRAPGAYRAAMVPVIVRRAFGFAARRALEGAGVVPVPATLAMTAVGASA